MSARRVVTTPSDSGVCSGGPGQEFSSPGCKGAPLTRAERARVPPCPGLRARVQGLGPDDAGRGLGSRPPPLLAPVSHSSSWRPHAFHTPVSPLPRGARRGDCGASRGGDGHPRGRAVPVVRPSASRTPGSASRGFPRATGSALRAWDSRAARGILCFVLKMA